MRRRKKAQVNAATRAAEQDSHVERKEYFRIVDYLHNLDDRRNLYEIFTRAFLDFAIPTLETFKWTLYLSVVY